MEQASKELTEFDSIICDSRIQMIKAAISFLGPREQRFLSVYVKYVELSKTINLIKNMRPDSLGICSITGKRPSCENSNFLQTIRKYCSDSERETIDNILNLMSAYKMITLFKESNNSEDGDTNVFDLIKGQLSPEQQEMFDLYSALINT